MQTTFIYGLECPINHEIKYIGKANDIKRRLRQHTYQSKHSNNNKSLWIKGLLSKGLKPNIIIIDEVSTDEWGYWEDYWITQFKVWGFRLLNKMSGGHGYGKHDTETIERISKSLSGKNNPMYGVDSWSKGKTLKPLSEETKEKISKANKGNTAWNKDMKYSNEKLKGNTNRVGKKHSEETRKKISESMKKYKEQR